MDIEFIPVLLVTGYLGSGKTTLLNRILSNGKGIKFAVIVNDLGEVNIDASLIEKGGIVGSENQDLVALQNGCICCTLKSDLMLQIDKLVESGSFDYIVIEASGICEPEPIARTICTMEALARHNGLRRAPRLSSIVTVADALRMKSDFDSARSLTRTGLGEDDIENLFISQIEFCNVVLLNKISEVSRKEADSIHAIIRAIQPKAEIIECDYAEIPIEKLLDREPFDFEKVVTSATWVRELERPVSEAQEAEALDPHEHHCHHHHDNEHEGHHCHHHHDHEHGEAEEYGIGTFLYYRRAPFNLEEFDRFCGLEWPANIIRTKGVLYFSNNPDMSILFEQAGVQKKLTQAGYWYATAPEEDRTQLMEEDPAFARDWDPVYGDRMIKLVFIGKNIDRDALSARLDRCLGKYIP